MIEKEMIKDLAEAHLTGRPDLFLLDIKILPGNRIELYIDGDQGVTISDCVALSRAIEGNLDREKEDFSLEVASGGISLPLKFERQYHKNVGRMLQVKQTDGLTCTGKIVRTEAGGVVLMITEKKKKVEKEIPYSLIKEAVITVEYK
jgi:ribosome maturation factor RimP